MKSVPKPLIAIVVILAAVAAYLLFGRPAKEDRWLGYVEGETLYVGAPVSGRLAQRPVERGASVAEGAPLFALDAATSDASVSEAEAQVAANSAQAADLQQARQRQADLDVARAAVVAARAEIVRSQKDFERIGALVPEGIASRAQFDAAREARDRARAALAQAQAQVRSGEQSAGREGQIAAARAGVAEAQAQLRARRQQRSEIAPVSPAKGVIEQTFFNPGEWVPANSPVVAVLPDDKRKLRFFVPEARVAALKAGTTIRFTCDGCGGTREARISYISPRAEFTPPVIYSERARAKLVFMVEALLPVSEKPLPLGLPVEVVPQ